MKSFSFPNLRINTVNKTIAALVQTVTSEDSEATDGPNNMHEKLCLMKIIMFLCHQHLILAKKFGIHSTGKNNELHNIQLYTNTGN